jgi:trimeric autotransporter adhesin
MKPESPPVLIIFALVCVALVQNTQAVSPPPDGGYLGGNTAEGQNALQSLTNGTYNTAIGLFSLVSNTEGNFNTAVGAGTLLANTGIRNTATGAGALFSNTAGVFNTAEGAFALSSNSTGFNNTASGASALANNITGQNNTANGILALKNNTTGSFNTALGDNAGFNVTTADNVICIGANVQGENVSNGCYIGEIFGQTASGGVAMLINSSGKLGTTTSSRRFKEEIKAMDKASETLFALKPVTFRYKKEIDEEAIQQFGLVAEDVEKVSPDLIVRDKEGKPYSVRYDQVNAMLLNEFLKEHRKVEEQQKQIDALAAQLKQQDAKIQKVSDKVDLNKSVPQIVLNNQ